MHTTSATEPPAVDTAAHTTPHTATHTTHPSHGTDAQHDTHPENGPRKSWVVLALALAAQVLVVLDISVVNTALPSIGRDL